MSYPPHHHGSGYPPYPHQVPPRHPPGPPYPYNPPPPTHSSGIFPSSLGFKFDAPMHMPRPGYPPPPPNGTAADVYGASNASYPARPYPHPSYTNTNPYPSTTPYPHSSIYPNSSYPSSTTHHTTYPVNSPYPNAPNLAIPSMYPNTQSYPGMSYPSSVPQSSYPHTQSSHPGAPIYSPSAPPSGYPSVPSYGHATKNIVHVERKGTPTVAPAHPFDPKSDAEVLRKAMKGFGTDEKAIINVLARRTNVQRLQIAVEFKTMYGKDLVKDLKSETSGKFEDLLVALMTPLPQFYAKELNEAISGLGTDEDVLIEVLCTKNNNEIRTIRTAYHSLYGRTLEDDLRGDTSGTFKRLMVALCNACRDESMVTNQAKAADDARSLLKAGELRLGTDESTFNMVLCQRNYAQLRLVFEEYYRVTGHDFEQAIKNEFSGHSRDCLLAIVRSIRNQPGFFAKCLRNSIAGLGTNDRKLIRVVVTRCEIDMGEVKQNYLAQYGKTLADDIKGDTSGDYKKCLLALIGES